MASKPAEITVIKYSLDGREPVRYVAEEIDAPEGWVAVRARWVHGTVQSGAVVFQDNDVLYEYFSLERPYNVFSIYRPNGVFVGWYCNVTYPTTVRAGEIHWHDLLVDVIISSDGQLSVHDEEDVERLGLPHSDPDLARLIHDARDELIERFRNGEYPFAEVDTGER